MAASGGRMGGNSFKSRSSYSSSKPKKTSSLSSSCYSEPKTTSSSSNRRDPGVVLLILVMFVFSVTLNLDERPSVLMLQVLWKWDFFFIFVFRISCTWGFTFLSPILWIACFVASYLLGKKFCPKRVFVWLEWVVEEANGHFFPGTSFPSKNKVKGEVLGSIGACVNLPIKKKKSRGFNKCMCKIIYKEKYNVKSEVLNSWHV